MDLVSKGVGILASMQTKSYATWRSEEGAFVVNMSAQAVVIIFPPA